MVAPHHRGLRVSVSKRGSSGRPRTVVEVCSTPGGLLIAAIVEVFPNRAGGDQRNWRSPRGRPAVILGHRRIEVGKNLRFVGISSPVNVPAIAGGTPAVHVHTTKNRFAERQGTLIVTIDFGVNFLHPASFI